MLYLIVYHYKINYILATPITGLENNSIFQAYKLRFDKLTAKGFKPKLNVMDIKIFLTSNKCKLQLVEPHKKRVNTTEQAIQTFKDAFIAALATTDSNFPIQL